MLISEVSLVRMIRGKEIHSGPVLAAGPKRKKRQDGPWKVKVDYEKLDRGQFLINASISNIISYERNSSDEIHSWFI